MTIDFLRGKRAPVLARTDDLGDRFYPWGDESFWSVTTLLSGIAKPALLPWGARVTAELAYRELLAYGPHARPGAIARRLAKQGRLYVQERQAQGALKSIKLEKLSDEDLALRYLKSEHERQRDTAAAIGSDVHSEAEKLVLEHARESVRLIVDGEQIRPWPADLSGYQASFVNWLADFRPVFLASEATIFNRREAYAGTLDCIVRIEIAPDVFLVVIVDYKSGNYVYPEVGMQLASYGRGEFIGAPDGITELPLPAVDRGAVLHLRPKPTKTYPRGYSFRWVSIDDAVYRKFLHAREIYEWLKATSKDVLGDEIEPLAAAA